MTTLQTVLLILVAVALVVAAVYIFRSGNRLPWPSIGVAALTCAVCFTVGGDTGQDMTGPDLATVVGALAGVLAVASAIVALVPRERPTRIPVLMSTLGTVVGAAGLLISLVTSS